MYLRLGCTVETERCEIWDGGFPKVCSNGISDSVGMSGNTLLSMTRLDAMTYGLHCKNPSLMFTPPGVHISVTKNSVTYSPVTQPGYAFHIPASNIISYFP